MSAPESRIELRVGIMIEDLLCNAHGVLNSRTLQTQQSGTTTAVVVGAGRIYRVRKRDYRQALIQRD